MFIYCNYIVTIYIYIYFILTGAVFFIPEYSKESRKSIHLAIASTIKNAIDWDGNRYKRRTKDAVVEDIYEESSERTENIPANDVFVENSLTLFKL